MQFLEVAIGQTRPYFFVGPSSGVAGEFGFFFDDARGHLCALSAMDSISGQEL
jgi:hypothetical protein